MYFGCQACFRARPRAPTRASTRSDARERARRVAATRATHVTFTSQHSVDVSDIRAVVIAADTRRAPLFDAEC